jgi:uncharacterized protein
MMYLGYAALGLVAGVLSGFVGVGGGIIIIPALVMLFGFDQLKAQGTSLAVLLPPIGILGFLQYMKNPAVKIDLWGVAVMALLLAIGAYFGAKWANTIVSPLIVRKVFACVMLASAVYLFFKK